MRGHIWFLAFILQLVVVMEYMALRNWNSH